MVSQSMAPPVYAILIAGEPHPSILKEKGSFEQMFLELLRDESGGGTGEGEEWRLYRAFEGELPTDDELASFKGLVVTGSVADAFGGDAWLLDLRRTVRVAMEQRKQVLGICFGHQLVGAELGARVGRAGCWELGARKVEVSGQAREQLEAQQGGGWARLLPDSLCLHEFHQDQVLGLPPGATLLASSERCPVEMFAVGSHVLCIQGHPEFDGEVVRLLADRHLGAVPEADAALMRDSMASLPVSEHAPRVRALCRAFLKGGDK